MKIKVFAKANDDEFKPNGKINNPNIPVASDFDDIIMSLNASKTEVEMPIQTTIKPPYLSKGTPKEEVISSEDVSIKERANEYLKVAEAEERQNAQIAKEESLLEHHETIKVKVKHLENELKAIDPDYAEIAAENEKEAFKAVKQKKKNSIPWRNYLVYLVLLTALTACFTFSKYISKVSGESEAVVAKFDVSVDANNLYVTSGTTLEDIEFDGYLAPASKTLGDAFTVTNASEVVVTVVPTVSGNTNFTVKFFKDGAEIPAGGFNLDKSNDGSSDTASIDVVVTPISLEESHTDSITISLTSSQKD